MTKPSPNLFIIGAMKAGTTSLHAYLASHPQIFMCTPKEPEFFAKESVWSKGEEWYLNLFASAKDELIIGESSTAYTNAPLFPGVPERIAQFNPKARLIYVMRDPVQRSISHYWNRVRLFGENREMFTAIRDEPAYRDVSNYAMQLAPYFKIFGSEQVATLTFEELSTNTANVVQKLFDWLGVDSSFTPPNLEERENVTPRKMLLQKNSRLNSFVRSPYVQALKPLVPSPILSITKRLPGRYGYVDRTSLSVDQVIEFLRPIQTEQVATLSKMLNRQFPEWTTLYADKQIKT